MKFNSKYFIKYKDMFNIYNLITKINNGYRLYFCSKDKNYYIININRNNDICLSFNTFSNNIIKELHFSKIENLNKNIKFIDNFNENLSKKNIENCKDLAKEKLKNIYYNITRSKTI